MAVHLLPSEVVEVPSEGSIHNSVQGNGLDHDDCISGDLAGVSLSIIIVVDCRATDFIFGRSLFQLAISLVTGPASLQTHGRALRLSSVRVDIDEISFSQDKSKSQWIQTKLDR